jgi:hypothetical protein
VPGVPGTAGLTVAAELGPNLQVPKSARLLATLASNSSSLLSECQRSTAITKPAGYHSGSLTRVIKGIRTAAPTPLDAEFTAIASTTGVKRNIHYRRTT